MLKYKKYWKIVSLLFYIGLFVFIIHQNLPITELIMPYILFFILTKIIFLGDTVGGFAIFIHIIHQNEQKAKKLYQLAYKLNATNLNVLANNGLFFLKEGDIETSKIIYEDLLKRSKLRPSFEKIFTANLGICYWKLGDLEKAIEQYNMIFNELRFSSLITADDYTTVGYLYLEIEDFDNAKKYTDLALTLDEYHVSALDNYGQYYYRKNNMIKAKAFFNKAVQLNEFTIDSNYWLGRIYEEENKQDLAKTHYKNALKGNITALNTVTQEEIDNRLSQLS
ncbi:tetratricopeptide repeat protein [Natranaerovirga hydrolytica]|uniref:Tetratricopeptide repeat protein n=1 Tax=Natranaerovirga hydrolytica TaxID=680378 RepID=A0A4R1MDH2_9FIRM|nr:tetratricopeptide repeat protein [Natranaerovirga hydrolytica]TCK90568.1 tetratricopeptide repeat protein [Natranaerovirga hydrolytica]